MSVLFSCRPGLRIVQIGSLVIGLGRAGLARKGASGSAEGHASWSSTGAAIRCNLSVAATPFPPNYGDTRHTPIAVWRVNLVQEGLLNLGQVSQIGGQIGVHNM